MDNKSFANGLASISIFRNCEQQINVWSGGTTTQLAIYPSNSEYKERNFAWRISSARVDLEESTFTSLPGVHRILMVLEGQIELTHEGVRNTCLKPFEQDEFDGGWTTKSRGKCIDFNLMMAGCSGKLDTVSSQSLKLFEREIDSEAWEAFYCLSAAANVTIRIQKEFFTSVLNKGDFLLIHAKKGACSVEFSHDCNNSPTAVRATIYKDN